jgi:hypothetical protein
MKNTKKNTKKINMNKKSLSKKHFKNKQKGGGNGFITRLISGLKSRFSKSKPVISGEQEETPSTYNDNQELPKTPFLYNQENESSKYYPEGEGIEGSQKAEGENNEPLGNIEGVEGSEESVKENVEEPKDVEKEKEGEEQLLKPTSLYSSVSESSFPNSVSSTNEFNMMPQSSIRSSFGSIPDNSSSFSSTLIPDNSTITQPSISSIENFSNEKSFEGGNIKKSRKNKKNKSKKNKSKKSRKNRNNKKNKNKK